MFCAFRAVHVLHDILVILTVLTVVILHVICHVNITSPQSMPSVPCFRMAIKTPIAPCTQLRLPTQSALTSQFPNSTSPALSFQLRIILFTQYLPRFSLKNLRGPCFLHCYLHNLRHPPYPCLLPGSTVKTNHVIPLLQAACKKLKVHTIGFIHSKPFRHFHFLQQPISFLLVAFSAHFT